ncbi:amino acid ABC transporter permease [Fretibacterium sp. OH1220_COT-178]|uniref:amino acid ABC transporter permease n=1 Tax=Fretibacterium sp. OH1220_COT-178 TaxID=2491047 RepID=UPI00131513CF|nr:amino acid ABC transporter permease [Fretibacterium sp. OH1220_COT-178]
MSFKLYVLEATLPQFIAGTLVTLQYTLVAVVLAIIWGILIGSLTYKRIPVLSRLCRWYVTFFRETPLLVQIYVIFYGLPQLNLLLSAATCGVMALVLNDGAFIAEIIRGGLQSIETGQLDAAASLGFSPLQTWQYFLLPQAWKKVTESIIGMISIILKDTSLLALITIVELTAVAQKVNAQRFEPTTAFLTAGTLYLLMFLCLEGIKKLVMRRRRYEPTGS